jgi:hypothetical protein
MTVFLTWRPAINSLVYVRHPDPTIARVLAEYLNEDRPPQKEPKYRVESLTDHLDGRLEANLQPEDWDGAQTRSIFTNWLIPA